MFWFRNNPGLLILKVEGTTDRPGATLLVDEPRNSKGKNVLLKDEKIYTKKAYHFNILLRERSVCMHSWRFGYQKISMLREIFL